MTAWFYSDTTQTYGPVTKEQLVAMIQAGQLVAGHFIMAEGAQEWQSLGASPFAGYLPPKASQAMPAHFATAAPQAKTTTKPAQAPQPQYRPAGPRQPQAVKPATGSRNLMLGSLIVLAAVLGWYFLSQKAAPARTIVKRLEGEVLKVIKVTGGEVELQPMKQPNALWSGDAHLWWHGGSAGYSLDLEFTVEPEQAGNQRLKAAFTSSTDYGVIEISLDGKKLKGKVFDLQANDAVISGARDLGLHVLAAGPHVLRIGILDTSVINMDKRDAYSVGLDYLQLEPPVREALPEAAGTNIAIKAKPSASFATGDDHVRIMNTSEERHGRKSEDQSQPRFTWHPHKSGAEWAQYEWETSQVIGECRVFWFDDSSVRGGGCAIPDFWRLLYREESTGAWVPVDATMLAATRDVWNSVKFTPVKTTALRLAVQCLDGWSAGICHWQVLAADPASVPDPKTREHPDLFLGDLSPLHAQVGWGPYRANIYGENDVREGRGVFQTGKACPQYLWAHANSRIDFAIPAGYTRLTAFAIGPSERSTGTPSVDADTWKASVLVDGKLMDQSDQLSRYKTREYPVDITFPPGSKTLTLITDNLGDGRLDHAFWAYPTLLTAQSQKRPATPVKAHAADLLFLPVPLPEGTLLTSKLSTTPIRARRQGAQFWLRIINQMPTAAKLYWLPGDGKQHSYGDISPGREHVTFTYEGHVWLITDEAGAPLAVFESSAASPVVCIDGPGGGASASVTVREPMAQRVMPARDLEIRSSREGGDPSEIRFINKLAEEVKIQFVRDDGRLTDWWKLKAGKINNQRTYIGHVWLITAENGSRLGLAESMTEKSTVIIDNQGVHVQAEEPASRESQNLVSIIQFTGTNIGDAVAFLRQRVAEAGLNVQIELDPRVNAKAGSIHLDALVVPLNELLERAAFLAGARLDHQGSIYRIVPR